jgi:hypothetical protein
MACFNKAFRLLLAGWVALLSPLWCCCPSWGDELGEVSPERVSLTSSDKTCSGCPAEEESEPTTDIPAHPTKPCDCDHHQTVGSMMVAEVGTSPVAPPQTWPVWVLRSDPIPPFASKPTTFICNIRGAPPNVDSQSLVSLHCLLVV